MSTLVDAFQLFQQSPGVPPTSLLVPSPQDCSWYLCALGLVNSCESVARQRFPRITCTPPPCPTALLPENVKLSIMALQCSKKKPPPDDERAVLYLIGPVAKFKMLPLQTLPPTEPELILRIEMLLATTILLLFTYTAPALAFEMDSSITECSMFCFMTLSDMTYTEPPVAAEHELW